MLSLRENLKILSGNKGRHNQEVVAMAMVAMAMVAMATVAEGAMVHIHLRCPSRKKLPLPVKIGKLLGNETCMNLIVVL